MKILAVGDMHGDLSVVHDALRVSEPDLILSPGDWGDPGQICQEAIQAIADTVHVLTVFGNHDDVELLDKVVNRDGTPILLGRSETRLFGGLHFLGISGIWAKSHKKPFYVTDEDVAEIIRDLSGKRIDVLVTHGCAIGLADGLPGGRHGGQRCFLDAFRALNPRLYVCGHLHYPQHRRLADGRLVVNTGYGLAGDYWLIDVDGEIISAEIHSLSH